MFSIPNSQRAELSRLLVALTETPGSDTRTANLRRRAKIAIKKLVKAKKTTDGK